MALSTIIISVNPCNPLLIIFKKSCIFIEHSGQFGIITIATEVAV